MRAKERESEMRILAAIDGSEDSYTAIDEITQRYFPTGTEVLVLCVVEPVSLPMTFSEDGVYTQTGDMHLYDVIQRAGEERARAVVEKAVARLQACEENRRLRVTAKVLSGPPKTVILDEAEAFGADLIIVGSHGYGVIERLLLGSVSQTVALHAKCSVEIVRRPKRQTSDSN
jgi:nucleotide-binding universal stress UspA family protein